MRRLFSKAQPIRFAYRVISHASVYPLSWNRTGINTQQEYVFATRSGGNHHTLAEPKFHLPSGQIGNHDD